VMTPTTGEAMPTVAVRMESLSRWVRMVRES
jgi:hypothetical protein